MRHLLISLIFVLFSTSILAAEKAPQTFGDWAKQCEDSTDPEGVERNICYIVQTVSNKEDGQKLMQVRVGIAPNSDKPIMIAIVPLGVVLPLGAAFVVEGAEPVKLPFLACGHEGCTTVGQPLDDTVLTAMRKGDKGEVRVGLLNKKVLPLPVSLKGFTRAFHSIAPQ